MLLTNLGCGHIRGGYPTEEVPGSDPPRGTEWVKSEIKRRHRDGYPQSRTLAGYSHRETRRGVRRAERSGQGLPAVPGIDRAPGAQFRKARGARSSARAGLFDADDDRALVLFDVVRTGR